MNRLGRLAAGIIVAIGIIWSFSFMNKSPRSIPRQSPTRSTYAYDSPVSTNPADVATATGILKKTSPVVPVSTATTTGTPPAAVKSPLLLLFRQEPNAILRREALQKWGEGKQAGVMDVATAAVTDSDPTVILQALNILARLGDKNSVPLLLLVLQENHGRPDGYGMPIREAAIRALGQLGEGSTVTVLVRELNRHEDLSYDNNIVEALGQIGDASALEPLNRQIARLENFKPVESIALEPLKQALAITVAARDRITKTKEK